MESIWRGIIKILIQTLDYAQPSSEVQRHHFDIYTKSQLKSFWRFDSCWGNIVTVLLSEIENLNL